MPVTDEGETVELSGQEFADYLGISEGYLSRAASGDYLAKGVRVSQYKVMHWKGNRVSHYEIPVSMARDLIPREEWHKFKID